MAQLLGVMLGGFVITGLVSRLARLPLRSRMDDKTRSVVAWVITVVLSLGISTYNTMGLGQALLGYLPTSLAWLLIDLHRARRSVAVTPAATDDLNPPRTSQGLTLDPSAAPLRQERPQVANPNQTKAWLSTEADEISQGILAGASQCLTRLKTTLPADKKLDPLKEWQVVAEYMFFLLHLCDRVAFGVLPLADRDAFMGDLVRLTLKRFSDACVSATGKARDVEQLQKEVLGAAMDRHSEYGGYKSEPAEGEGLRGTLLWEFGKRISQAVGFHPLDASVNYTGVTLAMGCLKALDLERRLTRAT